MTTLLLPYLLNTHFCKAQSLCPLVTELNMGVLQDKHI